MDCMFTAGERNSSTVSEECAAPETSHPWAMMGGKLINLGKLVVCTRRRRRRSSQHPSDALFVRFLFLSQIVQMNIDDSQPGARHERSGLACCAAVALPVSWFPTGAWHKSGLF
jgi:hypothetical protein